MHHLKRSSVSLALIQSPTQKIGTGLGVKLQIMQQLTTLVAFFQIGRVWASDYRYRASLIFYYSSTIIIIIVIICQVPFKLDNQVL